MAAETGKRSTAQAKALEPIESWRQDAGKVERLAQDVAEALEADDLPRARRGFTEYREQILAHLAREEDFTFPAAEARAPAQGGPIRSLRVAHIGIRNDLERVASQLALGHLGAARAVFRAFLETFAAHERLEDQLVELLRESS
jgi:iron-sulfur cluster repair protein YtfE (RIC family)